MMKSDLWRTREQRRRRFISTATALCLICVAALLSNERARNVEAARGTASRATAQTTMEWITLRMRSFAPRASGRLSIEPTTAGGRARLTALRLPRPRNVAPQAEMYVVWAVSEGRFVRLGELKLDERGNGGLEFERPAAFERYTVMVTAEQSATGERPAGGPVLSTKANEAQSLFASPGDNVAGAPEATANSTRTPEIKPPPIERRTRPRRQGDFYDEVDGALYTHGGGRTLELVGAEAALRAKGVARATAEAGNAYARLRFRDVPLPSTIGASTYVLWGAQTDGRILYMGSLPATSDINTVEIYVRTGGFNADDYYLFVTAEQQRPLPQPLGRRALSPRPVKYIVK